jgi:outer membrane protein OmpA-like peptidoglycan-associated protein
MNLRATTFITFLVVAQASVFAQTLKHKQASGNYRNFSYTKAIEYYEKIDHKSVEVKRQLAESYYMSGNLPKAEFWYEQVAASPDAHPSNYYRYAYMLRANGKYDESAKWIEKFGETHPADSRFVEFKANKQLIDKLKNDEGRYKILHLDVNSDHQDFATVYYKNTIVFSSTREKESALIKKKKWNGNSLPYLDIYEAKIAEDGQLKDLLPFEEAEHLNKRFHEGPVSFSESGNFMVYTRNAYDEKAKDGTVNLEIYSTEKKDSAWVNETELSFNHKEYSCGQPSLSPDGQTMYFTANFPGSYGGTDIYKSVRYSDNTWSTPENLGTTINTEGNEMFPFYHPSGILFFASDGHVGLGGLDIFLSIEKPTGFDNILNLGAPLNSTRDDFAFILNKESKNGYISSNREGGKGDDDIYAVTLLKYFDIPKVLKGVARNKATGKIMSNAIIKLTDATGKEIGTVMTGEDGSYKFDVKTDEKYDLKGSKPRHKATFNTVSTAGFERTINTDLLFEDLNMSIVGIALDKKTAIPLEGVKVKITNNKTGASETYTTLASGDLKKVLDHDLNEEVDYTLVFEKSGYVPKTVQFKKVLNAEGEYRVEAKMEKMKVNVELTESLALNPIYFDLNSYAITDAAKVELQKIVDLMKQYPKLEIELGSHTDCRETAKYNQWLSDQREKASAQWIAKRIPKPKRIYGKGYGETKLVNNCACEGEQTSTCDEAQHQANRRTEFKISKIK